MKMSTDDKVVLSEGHEDKQPCEAVMSKKQRKKLLKLQRLKETRTKWRY